MSKKWDEEIAKQILLELYESNDQKPFSTTFLRKAGYDGLAMWLYKNEVSPRDFCAKVGISHVMINAKIKRKWTTEMVVDAVKEAYTQKGSPVYDKWLNNNGYATPLSRIKKDGQSLYEFAVQHGIGELVEVRYTASGYSEAFIESEFRKVYDEHGELLCDAVLQKYGKYKLVNYVRKHFGGLDQFVKEHDLSGIYAKRYEVLTDAEVVNRVIQLFNQLGRKLGIKDIQNNLSGCAHFIYRKYGDFDSFCVENDITYLYEYRGGIEWGGRTGKRYNHRVIEC